MLKQARRYHQKGFSLVEIAIVLIIMSLLIGGLIAPLTAQLDARNYNQTRQQLEEIKEALIGFALSHSATDGKPYFPCPDTDGDGDENRTGSACTSDFGRLPTQQLGLNGTDSWNNPLIYTVTPAFSSNAIGFTLASIGNKTILNASGGGNIATFIPVVVISTGKNGAGGASAGDEAENINTNNSLVSREFTPTYDDTVVWVSPNVLLNRMVTAGRLP